MKLKLWNFIIIPLAIFSSCAYDPQFKVGTIQNNSHLAIMVYLDDKPTVSDLTLYKHKSYYFVEPYSTIDLLVNGYNETDLNHKWYFSFFSTDSIKKQFFNKKPPVDTAYLITRKYLLKTEVVLQKNFINRSIILSYK